jgi:hypothetical protein
LLENQHKHAFYNKTHFFFDFGGAGGFNTPLIASSNTFFKPCCVNAEHSKYFTTPISLPICTPCENDIGAILLLLSFCIVSRSSRKSNFVPTRISGVFGEWWDISGYH